MKLGISTCESKRGNLIEPLKNPKIDRFVNFAWEDKTGKVRVLQFLNQSAPDDAVDMLRRFADEIEDEIWKTQ